MLPSRNPRAWFGCAALIALAVTLRLVALRSDPYPGLDWDTGLMTDEGFYTHNARNVALFGHARLDEFNNMLVAPVIHVIQVAFFTLFGFGLVQARLISVLFSLASLPLFFAGLRRAFSLRAAVIGTAFLALDHSAVLFNRMALLDTPAAFFAIAAFYAFVRAVSADSPASGSWFVACGAAIALTFINRTLCVYLLITPLAALAFSSTATERLQNNKRAILAALAMAMVCLVYLAVWYVPHHAEISQMNHYYRTVQIQPDSWARLWSNVRVAVMDTGHGLFPYLFRHTPVAFSLAFAMAGITILRGAKRVNIADESPNHPITQSPLHLFTSSPLHYLAVWMIAAWLILMISNYSPSRYFVTMYPALFGLAGVAIDRWDDVIAALVPRFRFGARSTARISALLSVWLAVNVYWFWQWGTSLQYTQANLNRWLSANLPANSVLFGDVAPGAAIDTRFQVVNVMKELCNDRKPLERFAGKPQYLVLLDGGNNDERYWPQGYPGLATPEHRILQYRFIKWPISIYDANTPHPTPNPKSQPAIISR